MTGAGGMLGRDVVAAAARGNHEVVALARADLDVTDAASVAERVAAESPEAVLNLAAWTDVDGAESDPAGAAAVNVEGARNVAAAAAAAGARVLFVSTDYVFDGEGSEPWVESDATNPLSEYGRSKLGGEQATLEASNQAFVVRSSWLFGTGGRNFVATMLGLAEEHDEVVVVRDQVGCPTFTGHLAEALLRVAASDAYGIHHIAGSGHCSWYELAQAAFELEGVSCRVMSCTTAETARPARRPLWSVLGSERTDALELPDWREGLAAYLAERRVAA